MGLALLDASVIIATLERRDALHKAASEVVLAERKRHAMAISSITYAEVMVTPLKLGGEAVEVAERWVAQTTILDVDAGIARLAAELRASRNLKLPDAVVLATGLHHDVDVIFTGDARWRGIEKVQVIQADEQAMASRQQAR